MTSSIVKSLVLGAAFFVSGLLTSAHAQEIPSADGLKPFTAETNYMSLKGYLRWKASIGHTKMVRDLAFSPDGRILASVGLDGKLKLWSVKTKDLVRTMTPAWYPVTFSPDGRTIMSGTGYLETTVTLWDATTGQLQRKLPRDYGGDNQWFFWTRDGKILALGRQLQNLAGDTIIPTMPVDYPTLGEAQVLSPDGTTLAELGGQGLIYLKDVRTGKTIQTLESSSNWVKEVAFSPDSTLLASIGADTIQIWDTKTGQVLNTMRANCRFVTFSQDGKLLASGGGDDSVRIWDTRTGDMKFHLRGAQFPVAIAPDNKIMATGYAAISGENFPEARNTIHLWDLESGAKIGVLPRQR